MKTSKIALALAALTLAGASAVGQAPKREMRSVWLTTVWNLDWPYQSYRGTSSSAQTKMKNQLTAYLDDLQSANFTCVFLQVRSLADAMYASSWEPWSVAVSGARGTNPGWDPLSFAVEECHKRGMEIYAWVNPFRYNSSTSYGSTSFDTQCKNNGWIINNGTYSVFNPANADARAHILKVIKEIYTNYAIDGLIFDDYFYPSGGTTETTSAPDYSDYKASGTSLSIANWRRENVNTFIQEVYDAVQTDRPDLRFGISPAGVAGASASKWGVSALPSSVKSSDWQYAQIYSDPLAWLHDGSIDFISPQIYWETTHSTAPFGPLAQWWYAAATKFNRHFYASHDIAEFTSGTPTTDSNVSDVGKQVTAYRNAVKDGNYGQAFYSTKYLFGDQVSSGNDAIGPALAEGYYTKPSITPCITWKEHPTYDAPSNLAKTSTALSWSATTGARSNSIVRYTVYAIPTTVDTSDAEGDDGIYGQYLLGVTYDTAYTIPADRQSGYYFAVCVFDGYGYESAPAYVGVAVEPSTATTLKSPVNDAQLTEASATFSWAAVTNATYRLEIASDAAFASIVISQAGITATSATVDLKSLQASTRYYWRVVTTQSGKVATASAAATFITAEQTTGNFEEGYVIQTEALDFDDATFDLQNLWIRTIDRGNFSSPDNGTYSRGMVATAEYVYITGRTANSAAAGTDIYLEAYNALTGEHEHDVILSSAGLCSYYPNNNVSIDSKGTVCIANLSLNISSTPIVVHAVDLATGNLTEVASLTGSSGRVDYATVYGDVLGGDFYVFAVAANTATVYRWHVVDGSATVSTMTASAFFPTTATTFGIAPRVYPISATQVYVDGQTTGAALYNFSTGAIIDCPKASLSSYTDNGVAPFTLGSDQFVVYSSATAKRQFTLAKGTLAGGDIQATLPLEGLGSTESSTRSAPCAAVVIDDSHARFYVYSPGNGLAAYSLVNKYTGITNDAAPQSDSIAIDRLTVTFATEQASIAAYTLTGAQIAQVSNSASITLPAPGAYIIVTPNGARKLILQ